MVTTQSPSEIRTITTHRLLKVVTVMSDPPIGMPSGGCTPEGFCFLGQNLWLGYFGEI